MTPITDAYDSLTRVIEGQHRIIADLCTSNSKIL